MAPPKKVPVASTKKKKSTTAVDAPTISGKNLVDNEAEEKNNTALQGPMEVNEISVEGFGLALQGTGQLMTPEKRKASAQTFLDFSSPLKKTSLASSPKTIAFTSPVASASPAMKRLDAQTLPPIKTIVISPHQLRLNHNNMVMLVVEAGPEITVNGTQTRVFLMKMRDNEGMLLQLEGDALKETALYASLVPGHFVNLTDVRSRRTFKRDKIFCRLQERCVVCKDPLLPNTITTSTKAFQAFQPTWTDVDDVALTINAPCHGPKCHEVIVLVLTGIADRFSVDVDTYTHVRQGLVTVDGKSVHNVTFFGNCADNIYEMDIKHPLLFVRNAVQKDGAFIINDGSAVSVDPPDWFKGDPAVYDGMRVVPATGPAVVIDENELMGDATSGAGYVAQFDEEKSIVPPKMFVEGDVEDVDTGMNVVSTGKNGPYMAFRLTISQDLMPEGARPVNIVFFGAQAEQLAGMNCTIYSQLAQVEKDRVFTAIRQKTLRVHTKVDWYYAKKTYSFKALNVEFI